MSCIVSERVSLVAPLAKSIVEDYEKRGVDRFIDELYYPGEKEPRRSVALYFLVMVAMDHRLSRPNKPYEAVIEGERFHGADLLYRLGKIRYEQDPGFFEPESLAKTSVKDVLDWLCVGETCPPDPETRAALLRDLGVKLIKLFDGRVEDIIGVDQLRGNALKPGFIDLLRNFAAYSDPIEKKSFLLAKFLERRGVIRISDYWNKRVPVDNHVTRIAIRLGIVDLGDELLRKIARREEFNEAEDVLVRLCVREAWHRVAVIGGVDDFLLDDVLWSGGRRNCVRGSPTCSNCSRGALCRGSKCVFRRVCPVGLGVSKPLDEHVFFNTWWY